MSLSSIDAGPDVTFAPDLGRGRHFSASRRVRLSDCGPNGLLRPDGLARYLQDVATDDWDDTGLVADETWLARRTSWRLVGPTVPSLGESVTLTTWCSGSGAAWAERRTDVAIGGSVVIEASALWVPVGPAGRPVRVGSSFFEVYGEGARRRVSGRVPTLTPPAHATRRPWPLRQTDLDIVGHVNNAALWAPLAEIDTGTVTGASVIYHGAVQGADHVELVAHANHWWLTVENLVRVAGEFFT